VTTVTAAEAAAEAAGMAETSELLDVGGGGKRLG
jgi:hypothetical protein